MYRFNNGLVLKELYKNKYKIGKYKRKKKNQNLYKQKNNKKKKIMKKKNGDLTIEKNNK